MAKTHSYGTTTSLFEEDLEVSINTQKLDLFILSAYKALKLVTAASFEFCDNKEGDGVVRAKLADRQIMPVFETKRQFNPRENGI